MSRLIDADEFCMDIITGRIKETMYLSNMHKQLILNQINRRKTIDAVPVKHGHWINSGYACGETDWECSVCHCHEWRTGKTEYCMRCGAKMDEVTE